MKKYLVIISLLLCLFISAISIFNLQTFKSRNGTDTPQDWKAVENVIGRKGSPQGEVLKFTFPRYDLDVKVSGVPVEPALALTSWMAFKRIDNHAMTMGDLVLLQGETDTVISNLTKNGVDITALHNHLLREVPRIMYLHFEGHGDPVKLAQIMKSTLLLTNTPISPPPPTQLINSVNWAKIESILDRTGQRTGDLLQFSIPRSEKITEDDIVIPPAMGVATGIGFQAVGSDVATTGDFVLVASEVNPVVQALTVNGIRVTAVHNHMLFENPRLFFLHFWGYGNAERLAYGLKTALDQTNSIK